MKKYNTAAVQFRNPFSNHSNNKNNSNTHSNNNNYNHNHNHTNSLNSITTSNYYSNYNPSTPPSTPNQFTPLAPSDFLEYGAIDSNNTILDGLDDKNYYKDILKENNINLPNSLLDFNTSSALNPKPIIPTPDNIVVSSSSCNTSFADQIKNQNQNQVSESKYPLNKSFAPSNNKTLLNPIIFEENRNHNLFPNSISPNTSVPYFYGLMGSRNCKIDSSK
ncbi:uncharacterized protein ASCRUDRAFT_78125 [Ascoidea rubescens DSM 1968]|uniref:Uncharacterized protein n=1 Tax=Ascoidea rubescens DSM 1968 TaxID=1344418 RepID=A0A1D2V9P5_9ASCO|nr:hypothetical protein ASCRUDRAFT_78125 [Ascoidea rubescens DSM 1968]ODV58217.1 hypothetical protein ASCRUDRAFT_78125 [Ascoidea rubescens DSM 1968]